jgi:hypothetical protein
MFGKNFAVEFCRVRLTPAKPHAVEAFDISLETVAEGKPWR